MFLIIDHESYFSRFKIHTSYPDSTSLVTTCASSFFLFFLSEISFPGDSEEELTGGFEEITRKEKSIKGTKPGSRGKRLQKEKNFRYTEESNEEKQDYSESVSDDRESVPQGSSEKRALDKSNGALRENINGEEELDSEGREDDSDAGSSPRERARSHIEPSKSPYDDHDTKAEISDDVPLVNNSAIAALMLFWYLF